MVVLRFTVSGLGLWDLQSGAYKNIGCVVSGLRVWGSGLMDLCLEAFGIRACGISFHKQTTKSKGKKGTLGTKGSGRVWVRSQTWP